MTDTPATSVVFGIGCFSFEAPAADHLLMQNPEGQYSIHRWATDVERYLAAFPTIDNISVTGFGSVRGDHELTWRDTTMAALQVRQHDGQHWGGDLRPHPVRGRIQFKLNIPVRTQVSSFFAAEGRRGTRFDVDIHYHWGMPVAFVRSHDDLSNPSLSVAIVREYMRAEEKRLSTDENPIRFVAMGPSPLWSNFALALDPDFEEDAVAEIRDSPGYSWVTLRFKKTNEVSDLETAYRKVRARLTEAASTYYGFVSERLVVDTSIRFIESELEDLVRTHRSTGVRSWVRRLKRGGQKANDLMLEILAVEREHGRAVRAHSESWDAVRDSLGKSALREHVEREQKRGAAEYIDHSRTVVELLNGRYSRDLEMVLIVAASVVGGIVGSVITALAGWAVGAPQT